MARIIIFTFILLYSFLTRAQLSELMGELSVQGVITQQSSQSVGQGLSTVKKLQVLQEIRQILTEIQTLYFGSYQNISKNSLSKNYLSDFSWSLIGKNDSFYIQLNNVNEDLCFYLLQKKISDSDIQVNENKDKSCKNTNTIQYYFH